MDPITLAALGLLTLVGSLLPLFFKTNKTRQAGDVEEIVPEPAPSAPPSGMQTSTKVLLAFSVFVLLFGIYATILYWDRLKISRDAVMFYVALFIFMVGGMFVQVLASSYHEGKKLRDISGTQLIFPLLFSVIIYYSVWALAASGPKSFYALYAAFLNGYFWENIVSKAKPITP